VIGRWFWEKVQARLVVILASAFAAIEVPLPDPDAHDGEGDDGRTI
jgi:hypothetical protein